jgi:hypothetical protein
MGSDKLKKDKAKNKKVSLKIYITCAIDGVQARQYPPALL